MNKKEKENIIDNIISVQFEFIIDNIEDELNEDFQDIGTLEDLLQSQKDTLKDILLKYYS
tara:strand:+ start:506 stop:685 length:180 start_codon:yes stop_codon:yes gene_type:complete